MDTTKVHIKCPSCGQDERFVAHSIMLYQTNVYIEDGEWDYMSEAEDAEVAFVDSTEITCSLCGYRANKGWFDITYG